MLKVSTSCCVPLCTLKRARPLETTCDGFDRFGVLNRLVPNENPEPKVQRFGQYQPKGTPGSEFATVHEWRVWRRFRRREEVKVRDVVRVCASCGAMNWGNGRSSVKDRLGKGLWRPRRASGCFSWHARAAAFRGGCSPDPDARSSGVDLSNQSCLTS